MITITQERAVYHVLIMYSEYHEHMTDDQRDTSVRKNCRQRKFTPGVVMCFNQLSQPESKLSELAVQGGGVEKDTF